MHKVIVFITAVSIVVFLAFSNGSYFSAHGENFLNLFSSDNSRFKTVRSIDAVKAYPFVSEDRSLTSGFVPEQKLYAPNLNIVSAHASVIMDVDSGKILYEKNAQTERQIASLTKLFTATIVMEKVKDLDELVTIDEEAVYAEGTRIGCPRSGFCPGERLKVGEKISVRNLLKAALMNSANDSAIALGKYIGKTQDGFADIMNARARELGLEHSHFCTPSGLEPDGRETECYSSALDVAKIASHALEFPEIWQIMREEKQFISSDDGKYTHEIFNTDQLLDQLPNLIGTKTGFTPLAGYSLLAVASDESKTHRVVAVLLDDPYRWQSIQSMFGWSFSAIHWR